MATATATRSPNKEFPHGQEMADKIQKKFSVGMKVVGEQAPRGGGDAVPVIAEVTHVVKNGWIYVQVDGRSTDKQVDPTLWKPATDKDVERVKAAQAKAAAAAAKPAEKKKVVAKAGAANGKAKAPVKRQPVGSPAGEAAAAAAGARNPI